MVQNSFRSVVGRQIGVQQPDQPEGCDDPAVAAILAHPWAQIPASEKRYAGHREDRDRERDERRVGEEGGKPAPAEDGQAEIDSGAANDERQSDGWRHLCSFPRPSPRATPSRQPPAGPMISSQPHRACFKATRKFDSESNGFMSVV